jgi:integrase
LTKRLGSVSSPYPTATSSARFRLAPVGSVLRRALNQAKRWGLTPRNAAEAVDLPKLIRNEGQALSPAEAKTLLAACRGDRLEALYVLAVTCGLRQGELLGLMWEDVDPEKGTLRVRRQLQRMRDGSGLAFLPLKNPEGRREVALGPMALQVLKKHRARQAEEKLMLGSLYEDAGLVFATGHGTPIESSNLVGRSFKPLLRRAGLPDVRFHDLRHTCATLMLSTGLSPKVAQERLGHADVSVTMGIYSHVTPETRSGAAEAIEGLLGPTG